MLFIGVGEGDFGEVDAGERASRSEIFDDLLRDELRNALLGLLRAPSDVRGEKNVGQPLERRHERGGRILRLPGKNVEGRSRHLSRPDGARKSFDVDDMSPAEVQKDHPVPHQPEFPFAEKIRILGISVDVDRDHLRDAKEFVQRRDARRIPDGQFVDDVVIGDVHPHRFGERGNL